MARAGYADWDEHETFDVDERPSRPARKKRLPWLRLILLSSSIVAGLAYFAEKEHRPGPEQNRKDVPASVLIAPAPVWKPLPPGPPLFGFERNANPIMVEARQHTSGAREDTLVLGALGDARHARITLLQGASEPPRSFFIDMVRRAAGAGLSVARSAQSRLIATKFGPVETAAIVLAGTAEQECQAFRFSDPDAGFGFQGWLCSGSDRIEDSQIACFIDGIALTGAAAGPTLKNVFARTERSRLEGCGGTRIAAPAAKPSGQR